MMVKIVLKAIPLQFISPTPNTETLKASINCAMGLYSIIAAYWGMFNFASDVEIITALTYINNCTPNPINCCKSLYLVVKEEINIPNAKLIVP